MPSQMTPTEYAEAVAAEIRAEMARQRKPVKELAELIGVNRDTAARRLNASPSFTVQEIGLIADWLQVTPLHFTPPHMEIPA